MTIITQVNSIEELEPLISMNVNEIIVSPKKTSRRGTLSFKQVNILLEKASELKFKVFIQADILILENDFILINNFLNELSLDLANAIRVQDLGLANYINKKFNIDIHFICETGYHNLSSVMMIKTRFPHLTRIVLSLEVPVYIIEKWIKVLDVEFEILVLGPFLIFYSSRPLLSNIKDNNLILKERISSKEILSKKEFQVIENIHGTFIYYSKDICLLQYMNELAKIGVSSFRVDRFDNCDINIFNKLSFQKDSSNMLDEEQISRIWGKDIFYGFYKSNKTDLRFNVLKNKLRSRRGHDFLAVVLEASRETGYIVLYTKKELRKGMHVFIQTPLGDEKIFILNNLINSDGIECNLIKKNKIAVIPFRKGVSSQSYLYLDI